MYFTYILYSHTDNKLYAGYTNDLNLRIKQHADGKVQSTRHRRPLELIYYEACLDQWDAIRREKYFKTYYGKMFIKKRLKEWFAKNSA